ncbi:MAG TPA: UbiA family prenyltransferase [archaeon]|nr:UbiA family prenyltransferase [archaeon]
MRCAVGRKALQANHSSPNKIVSLLAMMRLPNCIMIGFAVIVGEFISSQVVPARAAFYGFGAGFLLLAASMILNDYFDREIDAINEPSRPLPSGSVQSSEALSFALILAALGLLSAASTGTPTLILAIISLLIMISYNARVKQTGFLGNVFVSLNVAIPFIYGGFAVGKPTWTLAIFALLAFLSSVGREIVKGITDVPGDKSRGVRSVAATKGNSTAAKYGSVFFLSAVALSAVPLLLGLVSYLYVPLVAICDVGFVLTTYSILSNSSPRSAKRNKKYVLVWMTFGLLAFLMGTL